MKRKEDIITFKVDESLAKALGRIGNRSEFIREAVRAALNQTCPLCNGSGVLSVDQKRHWEVFAENHAIALCEDCSASHIVCKCGGKYEPH